MKKVTLFIHLTRNVLSPYIKLQQSVVGLFYVVNLVHIIININIILVLHQCTWKITQVFFLKVLLTFEDTTNQIMTCS